jgi:hypothetical protein
LYDFLCNIVHREHGSAVPPHILASFAVNKAIKRKRTRAQTLKARKTHSTWHTLKPVAIAFSVARVQTVAEDKRVIDGCDQNRAISLHELGIINELDGPKYFLMRYSHGIASSAAHGWVTFNRKLSPFHLSKPFLPDFKLGLFRNDVSTSPGAMFYNIPSLGNQCVLHSNPLDKP